MMHYMSLGGRCLSFDAEEWHNGKGGRRFALPPYGLRP
jgi:hypothetical protein